MAKLKEYNGRYCEADFENAFLSFLEAEGWQYLFGNSIPRASRRDVLYVDDLEQFLRKANPDLLAEEIRQKANFNIYQSSAALRRQRPISDDEQSRPSRFRRIVKREMSEPASSPLPEKRTAGENQKFLLAQSLPTAARGT